MTETIEIRAIVAALRPLGKMVTGHAPHQRRQTESDASGGPADKQPRERQR
ncbi:hypothetical protein ACIRVK_35280 [Streptomyces sp. NPDC101152]|uniref:hypothetical protein n=1 Tax=Streptomyces sp. NPDC101152 TaxID=3366116 RepID=UPI0038095ACE